MSTGTAINDAWVQDAQRAKALLRNPGRILGPLVDRVVLPALGRHYFQSGIRRRTGRLYAGISQRGAAGNYVQIAGDSVRVGVSYDAIPYARYVLEGRGPVVAIRAKALRFVVDGKVIFRKRVGPAPAHQVYYLTDAELSSAAQAAEGMLFGDTAAGQGTMSFEEGVFN